MWVAAASPEAPGGSSSSARPTSSARPADPTRARVLIADDQPDVLLALRLLFKGEGFDTVTVSSPGELLSAVEATRFDVVLMDLNYTRDTTSGREGLEFLLRLRTIDSAVPVVVMTAWGSIDLAVEAMRRGANDFLLKPWDNAQLVSKLRLLAAGRAAAEEKRTSPGRDLALARKVQGNLFPRERPILATLEYGGECREAGAVGGDFYDFMDLGPGRMAVVVADASGKGVPAALLMSNLQGSLRSQCAQSLEDLPALLRAVNRLFFHSTAPEHFATLFFGVYDDQDRRLRYVNCGHNPPFLVRRSGVVERLAPTATAMGLFEQMECAEGEVRLAAGDTLLVYSDGITEARDEGGEEFGEPRLQELIEASRSLSPAALSAAVASRVEQFAGATPHDDLTIVAARGK